MIFTNFDGLSLHNQKNKILKISQCWSLINSYGFAKLKKTQFKTNSSKSCGIFLTNITHDCVY